MRLIRLLAVVIAVASPLPLLAQTADLDEILDKASDYVTLYERTFVGVVSEEAYRQQVRGGRTGTDLRGFPIEGPSQRRDLKSEVLLVRPPAADRWIQFRDVFEVDGKPVRDRDERLTKLFLQPSADAWRQEEDIVAASSRYNIGGVNRTVNLPVLALSVLELQNRAWFTFKIAKRSGATVELEYQEEDRGRTMIHTNDNQPMRAHGRITIDTATGRVLATTLATETATLRAQIEVTYGAEPAVDMLVPREMRERYTVKDGSTIEGRATYARFRRYQVKVEEQVTPLKK
jgi:hypothetical protein